LLLAAIRNDEFARLPLYRQLGYFALIQLCRLQCIFGDYHQALQFVAHVDLSRQHAYTRASPCIVSTYYYVSFAYIMMRRYQDAIVQLVNALLYIQRTKQSQPKLTLFEYVCIYRDPNIVTVYFMNYAHPSLLCYNASHRLLLRR
jgi:translation initiation factor 3 subunit L